MRRIFLVIFAVLASQALNGCTTVLLIDKATETTTDQYVVDRVDGAWLGEDDNLALCLFGAAPRRANSRFMVRIPAGDLTDAEKPAPLTAYRVPPDRITGLCGDPPPNARKIPVEFVGVASGYRPQQGRDRETIPPPEGSWPPGEQVPDQEPEQSPYDEAEAETAAGPEHETGFVTRLDYMERDAAGLKIYLFEEAGSDFGNTVIYRLEAPLPNGMEYRRLDFAIVESRPYEALFLLVPVTVAVDIVLIVTYVYLCSQAPGSC